MAFQLKPFNHSIFDMNPSDIFKDFGQGLMQSQAFKTDISEREDAYMVRAELPGMEKSDINVDFDHNVLTIVAAHNESNDKENEDGVIVHRERRTSSVKRQFTFNHVERDAIRASYDNGILEITLPKTQHSETSTSRIPIN
ncbi:Hsp20/alpha crystallin family protein [Staphylococcus hyicus]|uniref:Hsp20/alpha crystallin family protein n=1 Tax=Staphylococcus hyicus TaxID=1284 RepID=UPI00208F9B19|nr:Hsp20/alpha crystallin family protein [Staphylococcus hyicus]MCO4328628.1 Hsp20/alpha crystallin family protein [Staphylococcus hyicus]MCO4337217.1 Hsp20/alpha crystallin family protein [Staphylococcus hyicus]UWF56994.1 Hsp20/alpha crystallin family protein [Staphylococcus hyicus]